MAGGTLLQAVHRALAAGDKARAQKLLVQLLKTTPRDADAWLLMAEAQTDPQRRRECLDRAAHLTTAAPAAATVAVPVQTAAMVTPTAGPQPTLEPDLAPAPTPLLDQAIAAYNRSDRVESEKLLVQLIKREPRNADAWALRAEIQLTPARKRHFAERALELSPDHDLASAILAELGPESPSEMVPAEPVHPPERVQPPNVDALLAIAAHQKHAQTAVEDKRTGAESPFYLAWFIALINPSRGGYEALRNDPQASVTRASVWIVLTGLVDLSVLFTTQFSGQLAEAGVVNVTTPVLIAITIVVAVIGSLATLLCLYLNSLIVSFTASALGGEGSFRDQVYLSAAYIAPIQLLQATLVTIPAVGVFLSVGLSLYTVWLSINATRVAQELSALRALVALILPGILVFAAVMCAAITLLPNLQR
jgi:hypothetical protein